LFQHECNNLGVLVYASTLFISIGLLALRFTFTGTYLVAILQMATIRQDRVVSRLVRTATMVLTAPLVDQRLPQQHQSTPLGRALTRLLFLVEPASQHFSHQNLSTIFTRESGCSSAS